MATLLDSCIDQHGEGAKILTHTAIALGGMCLLPNFGFDSSLQDVINDLLQGQDPSFSGVRDVKVFAKSSSYTDFNKDLINLHAVVEMFELGKQLYPEEIAEMEVYNQLDEYWNESDIYCSAKEFNTDEFSSWMNSMFAENSEAAEPVDIERKGKVIRLIDILAPKLFSSSERNISMYCTTEDNNENTSFAPYFFVGDKCLVIVAKRWIL
jgi:hypothetical protein